MVGRKHTHHFKFTPVPGGMRRHCRCGYSVVEMAQGVFGDPVNKEMAGSARRKTRERNRYHAKKKKLKEGIE